MKQITNGKTLLVFDIHQNLSYANTALERESDFDHVVFLGDMIDTFLTPDNKTIFSVEKTCEWINEKFEELGDKATWLVGNHDCAYLASYKRDYKKTQRAPKYFCSGWTKSKAKSFNKTINPKWMDVLELCVQLGDDTVVSHAGFHPLLFKPFMTELENIKWFYNEWEKDKRVFHHDPNHWIRIVGRTRGGFARAGSPVWMDWSEFEALEEIQQIVGHSSTYSTSLRCKTNSKGKQNYCLDNMQQTFAVWSDGKLMRTHLINADSAGGWGNETSPKINLLNI